MSSASEDAAIYLADVDERLTLLASALDAYFAYRRHLKRTPAETPQGPMARLRADEQLRHKLVFRWNYATSTTPAYLGADARRAILPYALPIEITPCQWTSSALTAAEELTDGLLDTQDEVAAKLRLQELSTTLLEEPSIRLLSVTMTFTTLQQFVCRLVAHLEYAARNLSDVTDESPSATTPGTPHRNLLIHRVKRQASINGVPLRPFLSELEHHALVVLVDADGELKTSNEVHKEGDQGAGAALIRRLREKHPFFRRAVLSKEGYDGGYYLDTEYASYAFFPES